MALFDTDFSNQMSIWSFVNEEYPELDNVDLDQASMLIGQRTGIPFAYNSHFDIYEAKVGTCNFSVKLSTYKLPEKKGKKYLSVDVMRTCGDYEGCCQGVDSIDEAITFFERAKIRYFSPEEAVA